MTTTDPTAPDPTATAPADPGTSGPLSPTDHRAFAFLGQANSRLRQCLCTLARHGVAVRGREPERARLLLDTVRPWPLYKGGQFLFDLMEWEDLMVDGDPPPLLPAERIAALCSLPVQWLAATTAGAPAATRLIPGRRTAAALDLPLRLLAGAARAALQGAAQDLTDLLGTPGPKNGTGTGTGTGPGSGTGAGPGHGDDSEAGPAGSATADGPGADTAGAGDVGDELPPLEAGFYLYEDIALGALAVLGPLLAEHAPTASAAEPDEPVSGPDEPVSGPEGP
ncbi:hypothetical protein ACF061_13145 [Streptomyces sp. NPDC015220]|uniref:hypothetical protein n=1 Tax=Streptomyces sp. NPDC015220 TaxID=3364947 RepID=UPI0036F7B525